MLGYLTIKCDANLENQLLKVHMQPFGILYVCDVWYILGRNAIYFLSKKLYLHQLFAAVKLAGTDII